MREQLLILWELQNLEQEKRRLVSQREQMAGEDIRALWSEVALLAQQTTAAKERLEGLEKVARRQQLDLDGLAGQSRQLENRLYSGDVGNSRELEAVRAKHEALKREIRQREDEAFATLEESEGLAARIAASEQLLNEKRQLHARRRQEAAKRAAVFDGKIAEVDTVCADLTSRVDAAVLAHYAAVARRISPAVAMVQNGVCGGCRVSVPTGQLAVAAARIALCDNCGRLLLAK